MPHSSHFPPDLKQHLGTHLTSFRFELVIIWRVQIDEEGKVLPKLDLLPKAPQQGRGPWGGGVRTSDRAQQTPASVIWFS